ncbi:MAG: serine hydrolase domain-containing protein [Hyphomicrobiales bacterium]
MKGFPSPPEGQVTLANWRTGPFCRWAFHHVREIVPSADIANEPDGVWHLDEALKDLSPVRFASQAGPQISLEQYFGSDNTDALVVLHKGKLVHEAYPDGMAASVPHILMSVSKSVLALVAGIAIGDKALQEEDPVEKHVPEITGTAFARSTVRDLLDMQVGVKFDEDYLAQSGPIIDYRKATNWNPVESGDEVSDLRTFFTTLTEREDGYDGRFHYVSPCSDLLGWVVERAVGRRFADYMSDVLWKPLGAEFPAYITVDRLGAPRVAGGICVAARDLARLGQLISLGGNRDGRQIIPQSWIDDIIENGSVDAWQRGDFSEDFTGMPLHYRSKWYVLRGDTRIVFGLGIHGQYVFIDQTNDIVVAIMSSQAAPVDIARLRDALSLATAVMDHLKQ